MWPWSKRSRLPKLRGYVFDPKPDITALELAVILSNMIPIGARFSAVTSVVVLDSPPDEIARHYRREPELDTDYY